MTPEEKARVIIDRQLEEAQQKPFNWFKLWRICSYVLFAISLICVLLNIFIRYSSTIY